MFKCIHCPKEFKSYRALNAHQIAHKIGNRYSEKRTHPNRKQILKPKHFHTCKICETKFEHNYSSTNQYCGIKCSAQSRWSKPDLNDRTKYNRARNNAAWHKYQMLKRNQIPPNADLEAIKQIYINCPKGHHVDHIKPISKGGLHHQDNLQYLTVFENCSKNNKY